MGKEKIQERLINRRKKVPGRGNERLVTGTLTQEKSDGEGPQAIKRSIAGSDPITNH